MGCTACRDFPGATNGFEDDLYTVCKVCRKAVQDMRLSWLGMDILAIFTCQDEAAKRTSAIIVPRWRELMTNTPQYYDGTEDNRTHGNEIKPVLMEHFSVGSAQHGC